MATDWREQVRERLELYGHRNWIVVADQAYPAQAAPGIEMLVAGEGPIEVLQELLATIGAAGHVRPRVLVDRELQFVAEADAPGVSAYRAQLEPALAPHEAEALAHEEILARLDAAGRAYRILVIKTPLRLPYTSVFLALDCGYWSGEAEERLRALAG